MFGETTIFYVMIWNHAVETTIKNWMFGVPGGNGTWTFQKKFFPLLLLNMVFFLLARRVRKYWSVDRFSFDDCAYLFLQPPNYITKKRLIKPSSLSLEWPLKNDFDFSPRKGYSSQTRCSWFRFMIEKLWRFRKAHKSGWWFQSNRKILVKLDHFPR